MLGIFPLNIPLSREDAFRLNPHKPVVLLGLWKGHGKLAAFLLAKDL